MNSGHVELAAEGLFYVAGFSVTNTMLTAWLTILVLGGVSYAATRRMKLVPTGLQNAVEAVMEMMLNFVEDVAGKEYGRKFFPVIATIFLFVVTNAWLALLPGFATIGVIHTGEEGEMLVPLLRGANTDINFPLALALVPGSSPRPLSAPGVRPVSRFRWRLSICVCSFLSFLLV